MPTFNSKPRRGGRRVATVLPIALAFCLLALSLPALATAATYTVNSIGDQGDENVGNEICKTSVSNCTLRAAIQESNASTAVDDTIDFSPLFNGESLGTITLETELPSLTDAVAIKGTCTKAGGVSGPCVGLTGAGTLFTVHSPDVSIEGLAMYPPSSSTGTGINVLTGSPRFKAGGDWIGTSLAGTQTLFLTGVNVNSAGITAAAESAQLTGLKVAALGVGVALEGPGAVLKNSNVLSGLTGLFLYGANASIGNRIEGSTIRGNVEAAIAIYNDDNKILGDEIINELSYGGVYLSGASGNVIGGDQASEENVFSATSTNAITIKTDEASQNEIGRNRGTAGGKFINLESTGVGTPNGGIQPPPIAAAFESSARGSGAAPGAKIRVFSKATEAPGEVASFLGTATADSSGNWRVVFSAKTAAGTIVTATQTNTLGGTSELAATAIAATNPACPSADAVGCETPPPPPGPPDTTKPKVTIKKAPKANSTATTAKFKFVSSEAGSFQCKLDKKAFAKCRSPKTYKKLKPGKHVFKVKATDPAGNVSKVLTRKFTVLE